MVYITLLVGKVFYVRRQNRGRVDKSWNSSYKSTRLRLSLEKGEYHTSTKKSDGVYLSGAFWTFDRVSLTVVLCSGVRRVNATGSR